MAHERALSQLELSAKLHRQRSLGAALFAKVVNKVVLENQASLISEASVAIFISALLVTVLQRTEHERERELE